MVANDLRQRIRDKSVLIFSLLVPLALMGVLNLSFGGFDSGSATLKPAVVIANSEDSGPLGSALLEAVDSLPTMDVTIQRAAAGDVRQETKDTGADLGIILPADFTTALSTGRALSVQIIEGDAAGLETGVLVSVVDGLLQQFSAGTVTATAGDIAAWWCGSSWARGASMSSIRPSSIAIPTSVDTTLLVTDCTSQVACRSVP